MKLESSKWWQGKRGEWYVAGQIALVLLVFLGPRAWPGMPAWSPRLGALADLAGGLLLLAGLALVLAGILGLGRNLTALPCPKDQGELVQTGAYRIVRHPMYGGGILIAFGWGLWVHGVLTLGYAALLLLFFDIKSRREERWLSEKYPEYPRYRARVRKLIPLVY
jgi:protein-S-isoprenylcysteine O-methyltransferase Ste14